MRALAWDGTLQLRELPKPEPVPGEALIKPIFAGICATDLHLTNGYKGFEGIPGHEFVGVVEQCDDAAWIGVRVVGDINIQCGMCAACLRGDTTHCLHRTTLGINGRAGAMADFFTLPVANLHRVPDTIPDEAAVFVEPLAAAIEILDQTHIRPADRVAIVGDGKLGLLVAQVLRLVGVELAVVGHHPERWPLLQAQGVHAVNDAQVLGYHEWDIVIDCTGSPAGFAAARDLVRPRGRLVLKSTFHGAVALDVSSLVVDEIVVMGSRCGSFEPALRMLERGLIETSPLLDRVYPLAEAVSAFEAARGRLKVLLKP